MKLKRKVITELTKIESGMFKDVNHERRGLLRLTGLLDVREESMWKDLRKIHKFPKDKKVAVDIKTRELYYEVFE